MESEILLNIKDLSWGIFIISVLVFAFTMLIKWPIKRATSKLNENKRKAVNTVIVFIPMLLSLILNALYYGIFTDEWFTFKMFDGMVSSYLLAIAIYAFYSRLVILIKGTKKEESHQELSKETVAFIKNNVKAISKTLKIDEKKFNNIIFQLDKMLLLREEIKNDPMFQDIPLTENLDIQIKDLQTQKDNILQSITSWQDQLVKYQNTLKEKGE